MQYTQFKTILNSTIFAQAKADLLTKVATYSNRYIGIFRPTKPKAKLLQNLLQSHEIRFGDAFERLLEAYLAENGFQMLPKDIEHSSGDRLSVDQFFKKEEAIYFVEQKVRDDHDSTKKRGQLNNFEKKLATIVEQYGAEKVRGFFYFADPSLQKNRIFYGRALDKMTRQYGVNLHIAYGAELLSTLGIASVWQEIEAYLVQWRAELPDTPNTNFDLDAGATYEEIKDLPILVYRKLLEDEILFQEIILTLFPEKKTLQLLVNDFENRQSKLHRQIALRLLQLMRKY